MNLWNDICKSQTHFSITIGTIVLLGNDFLILHFTSSWLCLIFWLYLFYINIQKGSPRLDKSVTFHQHYQSDIENNVTVLVPIIAYPKPQNISWVGGPLTAPRYTIEGTITPKKMSYVYRYLVKGNIRLVNESIFGNTTLYIDGVEVVTMFILKKGKLTTNSVNLCMTLRSHLTLEIYISRNIKQKYNKLFFKSGDQRNIMNPMY